MSAASSQEGHAASASQEGRAASASPQEGHTLAPSLARGWFERLVVPLLIFVASLGILGGLAWDRVGKPSTDPHFAWQANAWLEGSLELTKPPPHRNDWASVEWLRLKGGEELRGAWEDRAARRFQTLDGRVFVVDEREVAQRGKRWYMSFPPGPSALMLPLALVQGYEVGDVSFTLFFGALNVALVYLLLRRLTDGGRTGRGRAELWWLTVLFGAGTVHLWCAVLGQVWFTALVVGATFTLLYMLASLDARHPFLAGLCLAVAFATRTPLLFSAVFFAAFLLFPGGQLRRDRWGEFFVKAALFALPCVVVGGLLMWANHARFGSLGEFGHTYLAEGQVQKIQKYGLFHWHFLSKNLSAAFTLLPKLSLDAPYVQVSRHGMSLLLTTPAWAYLLWPKPLEGHDRFWWRALWATVAAVAVPGLLYQNTGYEQFGYRFSLDYTPYLVALLAVGRTDMTRWFRALIVAGVLVNTFGAVTFKRHDQFYMSGATFFEPD